MHTSPPVIGRPLAGCTHDSPEVLTAKQEMSSRDPIQGAIQRVLAGALANTPFRLHAFSPPVDEVDPAVILLGRVWGDSVDASERPKRVTSVFQDCQYRCGPLAARAPLRVGVLGVNATRAAGFPRSHHTR